jgi:hypothetical protein
VSERREEERRDFMSEIQRNVWRNESGNEGIVL